MVCEFKASEVNDIGEAASFHISNSKMMSGWLRNDTAERLKSLGSRLYYWLYAFRFRVLGARC